MNLEDILKALGNENSPEGEDKNSPQGAKDRSGGAGADPLSQLLGSLLGGATPASGGQGSADMGGLLGSLLGGGAGAGAQGAPDLSGLLGALLGGAGAPPPAGGAPAPGGDVLGTLGGNAPQGTGGTADMGGVLGALLGGGAQGSPLSGNAVLAPMVEALSQKLGLPPEIAGAVVTFALSKLLGGLLGGSTPGASAVGATPLSAGTSDGLEQGNNLVSRITSGQGLDTKSLRSMGLSQELAQQTGMDEHTAAKSLQHVFGMLGDVMGPGQAGRPG